MSKERWRNAAILSAYMILIVIVLYFMVDSTMRDWRFKLMLFISGICLILVSIFMQWMLNRSETKAYVIKNGYEHMRTTHEGHELWRKKTENQVFIKELDAKGFVVVERRYDATDIRNMEFINCK